MFAIEMCAGGGGQALGLEQAGFACEAALEIDPHALCHIALEPSRSTGVESRVEKGNWFFASINPAS